MIKYRLFWCSDCLIAHSKKYPERRMARQKVKDAIKCGKLIRGNCEKCGSLKACAHHEDYSKPLDVRWFCHKCHAKEHKVIRDSALNNPHRDGTLIQSVSKMEVGDTIYVKNKKSIAVSCFYILRKKFNEVEKKFKATELDGLVVINRLK